MTTPLFRRPASSLPAVRALVPSLGASRGIVAGLAALMALIMAPLPALAAPALLPGEEAAIMGLVRHSPSVAPGIFRRARARLRLERRVGRFLLLDLTLTPRLTDDARIVVRKDGRRFRLLYLGTGMEPGLARSLGVPAALLR